MGLIVTTPPAVEPVTLTEAKDWARIDIATDDTLVTALIKASRQGVETFLRRTLITTTYTLTLDSFPGSAGNRLSGFTGGVGEILLPAPPLQSVTTLKYLDSLGVEQTLTPVTDYTVDTSSTFVARIVPAPDTDWPDTLNSINTVIIEYIAGYGLAVDVIEEAKTVIKMRVDNLYEHRSEMEEITTNLNETFKNMLWSQRAFQFDVETQ